MTGFLGLNYKMTNHGSLMQRRQVIGIDACLLQTLAVIDLL